MIERAAPNDARHRRIRKFNPGAFQSDDEVDRQFVVRQRELDLVLEVVRGNIDSPSCQHVLIVGPRGRGKTMLLARVGAELRTDNALSQRLFPVRFMEESQEVATLADFWLEALFHLAHANAAGNPKFSQELLATHADLTARWRDTNIEDSARAAFLEAADRLNRKIVLMVENLQDLCDDFDDDFGWKLRQTLQSEPRLMMLATATSRFKGLDDANQPFFELFRIVDLEPLDTDACRRLWNMASGDERTGREIKPLRILTGGSPRLLIIIATFARRRSLRRLLEDLVTLVDDHTEYFRSHLDVLAKTERRVYLAVIDLWQPSSAHEIAVRARMDIRTVSTLIGRLVNRGAVIVEGTGRKRKYAAAERLYSIYYKLRRERDEAGLVCNLIQFMMVFYHSVELPGMVRKWREEAAQSAPLRKGLEQALTASDAPGFRLEAATALLNKAVRHHEHGEFDGELPGMVRKWREEAAQSAPLREGLEQALAASDAPGFRLEAATALLNKGVRHHEHGEFDAALAAYDDLVKRFGDSDALELQIPVSKALFNKGITHARLGAHEAALTAYDDLVKRYGASNVPELQVPVSTALLNKGFTHDQRGEQEAALAAYDDLVEHYSASDALELQVPVSKALLNKGITHGRLGAHEAALAAYDDLLARYGASNVPELQVPVSKALLNKGVTHGQRGEQEAALAAYDDLLARYGASNVPELQVPVSNALLNKGVTHGQRGEQEAALAAYDDLVARYRDSNVPELQVPVSNALLNKGVTHARLGAQQAALAAYDDLLARYRDSNVPELQVPVSNALLNKGVTHARLGAQQAALAAYDDLLARYRDSNVPELQVPVSKALLNKGVTHEERGEQGAALAAYDDLLARYRDSNVPELQVPVSKALLNKGVTHEERGEQQAALAAYDDLVERYSASDALELQVVVSKALLNKGITHGRLGAHEAELAAYDDLVDRFGASNVPELQVPVSNALLNKGIAHGQRGEQEPALAAYDELVARYGASNVPELLVPVSLALLNKGVTHGQRGEQEAALAAYDDLLARYGASNVPELLVPVSEALLRKGEQQIEIGRAEDALRTGGELDRRLAVVTDNELNVFASLRLRLSRRPSGRCRPDNEPNVAAQPEEQLRFADVVASLRRQAKWMRMHALFVLNEHPAALSVFQSVCDMFVVGNETMLRDMLARVPILIAAGARERDLVEILSANSKIAEALAPLVVALRRLAGEPVRAPAEVFEVAADVCKDIEEAKRRGAGRGMRKGSGS